MEDKKLKFKRLNSKYDLKFFFFFIVMAFIFYQPFIKEKPLNTHVWRQADCLSLTQNYYEGAPFFEPEMNILLGNNLSSGKSAGEFPIIYYSVAQIWKVFGPSYFSYRFFLLIILSFGIFAFYRSLQLVFESEFWSIILSLLLFSSPVLAVYGVSFLPDGPAFSFNLIALYFITLFVKKEKTKFFYYAMMFFALAGLIKVSSLIVFIFLGFIYLLERFPVFSLGKRKLFPKWQLMFGFGLCLASIVAWYSYAYYYNVASGFKYTFNDIYPIWLLKETQQMELWNNVKGFTSHVFYSRSMIMTLFFLFLFNLFLLKKIPLIAYLANLIITIGSIFYLVLWGGLIGVHDYYYISALAVFIGIILPFVYFLKVNHANLFLGKMTKSAVYLFFGINFIICFSTIGLKSKTVKGDHVLLDSDFVSQMKWTNWHEQDKWTKYERITYFFKSWNIRKEDKVICLSDFSFNASLYFLGRKGWTNFLNYSTKVQIEELIQHGAKFLFIQEEDLKEKPFLAPFVNNQIGKYKDILVYKL